MSVSREPTGAPTAPRWFAPPGWQAFVLMAPSLLWLAWDRTPWRTDQAWYGEVAVDLWWTLTHHPDKWWPLMLDAFAIKAPAISWLGQFLVPLGHWMGSVDDGLLLLPWAASAWTVHLWFRIGCTLWAGDTRGGWLCAGLGAGSPLFVALTHQFFVEALQLLGVTALYWLAMHGARLPRLTLALRAALALTFLISVKVTSPVFCIVPLGLIGWQLLTGRQPWLARATHGRVFDACVVILTLGMAVPTGLWYLRHFDALRKFVAFAAQSESSLYYGSPPEFFAKWSYWLPGVHREFFHPVVGFGLVPGIVLVLLAGSIRKKSVPTAWWALAGGAVLQGLLVLQGFALQIPEITRYALALLVSALIPLVILLGCGPRRLVVTLGLALMSLQWGWSHGSSLGILPAGPRASEWLWTADPDPSRDEALDRLISATTDPATAPRYHVNGYETPWLNANSLAFHAAKARLASGTRGYYTSLGFGAKDPGAALARLHAMEAESFISVELPFHAPQPTFMNQVARQALESISQDPRYGQVPFSSAHNIVLYRRVPNRQ